MLRSAMPEAVRTSEEDLAGLPDYPFAPGYREVDGLRVAHIDEGEGAPVIFIHGEPTWSYLWRKVIPPVRDAGFRCVAPDLVGFGASDKPTVSAREMVLIFVSAILRTPSMTSSSFHRSP